MCKIFMLMCLLLFQYTCVAKVNDPYASDLNDLLHKDSINESNAVINAYMDKVSVLSYAVLCQVLYREQENVVLGGMQSDLFSYLNRNNLPYNVEKLEVENQNAYDLGRTLYKQKGCEFWHQHPEIVKEIRDYRYFY